MIDLLNTFIANLWIDKKTRYIFIFVIITTLYNFSKWLIIFCHYTIYPVKFDRINDDGSITFTFAKKYEQQIYPKDYQLPTRNGKRIKEFDMNGFRDSKQCECDFFKIYKREVMSLINSSAKKEFTINFDKKFPKKIGEISFIDIDLQEKYLFKELKAKNLIFDSKQKINYCEELLKRKTHNSNQ